MLQNYIEKKARDRKLRKIAEQARNGIVPKGVTKDEVMDALRLTRPKSATEMFGFLTTRVFNSEGKMVDDYRLQSVKKVTTPFVKLLADAFCSSTAATLLSRFIVHGCGDGSTAEASGDLLLVREAPLGSYARVSGSQTHGASSNIYKTVKTWGALTAFTVIEHGIFDTTTTSAGNLLDRSLVTTPPTVASGDEVEFTYELTINSET